MDINLIVICGLTFVIHLVGTFAYAIRIAGIRTGRIATAMTLFNILTLASRTSNSFQAPFVSKRIEKALLLDTEPLLRDFHWILLFAALATLVGGLLIPTLQRIFSRAVILLQEKRSLLGILLHALVPRRFWRIKSFFVIPSLSNFEFIKSKGGLSINFLILNVVAVALWSVGVFASLYAGILEPQFRVTCSNLSSIINGVATIVMFMVIDPHLAMLSDDVLRGKMPQSAFRGVVSTLVAARLAGVLLAQLLLWPSAKIIAWVAAKI